MKKIKYFANGTGKGNGFLNMSGCSYSNLSLHFYSGIKGSGMGVCFGNTQETACTEDFGNGRRHGKGYCSMDGYGDGFFDYSEILK